MRVHSILIADGDRTRADDLVRRLHALGFARVSWTCDVKDLPDQVMTSRPDLLIVQKEWAGAVPATSRNGHTTMALLVLGEGPQAQRFDTVDEEKVFAALPYPVDDTILRLIVSGALLRCDHLRTECMADSRFRALAGLVSDYAYSVVIAADGTMVREWVNGTLKQMTGYSEAELQDHGGWRALVHPDDLSLADEQSRAFLRGEEHVCDFRILMRDGRARWLRHRGLPTLEDGTGRVIRITVVVSDITKERAMKEALRDSEERWQFALDASEEGVWDWDVETGQVYHSERWRVLTGFDVDPASDGVSEYMKHVHPEDRKLVTDEIRKYFRDESREFKAEYRLQIGDSSYRWVLDRGKIVGWTPDGRPRRVVGTIADVTARRQAEEDLARTNEFLREVLQGSSTIAILSTDEVGMIEFWNSGAENLLGYTAEEIVGKMHLRGLQAEDGDAAASLVEDLAAQVIHERQTVSRVLREVHKDGSIVWMKLTFAPRVDRQGAVRGMLGIGENLTPQVNAHADKEQREREVRLLAFTLNCALDGFCITDLRYNILYVNDSLRSSFGYGEDELLGQNIRVLHSANITPDLLREIDQATRKQGWRGTIQGKRKDGSEFPLEVSTAIVRNDLGEPVATVAVTRDITERVHADGRIRASLKEKEVMLKEIHHRVKNNLQVISSLLNLQSAQEQNPVILAALKESQGRVRSMALVHEELYRSNDLADIPMESYIRKLTANLFFAYQSATTKVALDIQARDVYLPIDTAVPCGLIINELVSNSLKHGFTDRGKGMVTVRFRREDQTYHLVVSDDGVGLPRGLDIEKTESLGLQLVSTLTKQLRGTIGVECNKGTTFSLSFALPEKQSNA